MKTYVLSLMIFGTLATTAHAHPRTDAEALARLTPAALAREFERAPAPLEIPSGYAQGTHVIPPGSVARLPWLMEFATFHLWKGKTFDSQTRMMTDELVLPGAGPEAELSIGRIDDYLVRAFGTDAQPDFGDGRDAVITDYSVVSQMEDPRGWIDEFRQVRRKVWLGRSFYRGKFWGYVILYFR